MNIVNPNTDSVKDYKAENVQQRFYDFLDNFQLSPEHDNYELYAEDVEVIGRGGKINYYHKQAEKLKDEDKHTMYVDFTHINLHDTVFDLSEAICSEYYRYEPYLIKAVSTFMTKLFPENANKRYYLAFYNLPNIEKMREQKTARIGRLISLSGTVTRSTEVRPELIEGAFDCKLCGTLVKGITQQFKFTEPQFCTNSVCDNRTKWELNLSESVFVDWQKYRVQENAQDIPPGSMPRSIDVVVRNEIVDAAKPGDRAIFTGSLIVVPDIVSLLKPGERQESSLRDPQGRRKEFKGLDGISGLKRLGVRDLSYKLVFIANSIHSKDTRFGFINIREEGDEDSSKQFTEAEKEEMLKFKQMEGGKLYEKLADSIAPSVFGHDEVKKGILLMLFGGINKTTSEGLKLRGDINICIVGDPSTAKSQFLKYVASFLPRSVYTSGKASTAAGLTASVLKDPETGEFCIEAGALMLADNGICCIDEFDKMDVKDQVAIHEAMEQQTISIAKAGIQATLNARTSILAAANPVFGRYDRSKSLKYNIEISAALMSRFDLFFIIVDEQDNETDFAIAEHITKMHRNLGGEGQKYKENKAGLSPFLNTQNLQKYIRFCRCLKPKITHEAAQVIRESYKMLRTNDRSYQKTAYRITVRQLESLIRLSEALARMNFDTQVLPKHVREAAKLIKKSIINVQHNDVEIEQFPAELPSEQPMQTDAKEEKVEGPPNKTVISFDEYETICRAIAHYVKSSEIDSPGGVKQGAIINWYIEEHLENIDTAEEAQRTASKLTSVIERLINNDGVLIVTSPSRIRNDRILSLNINFEPMSMDLPQ